MNEVSSDENDGTMAPTGQRKTAEENAFEAGRHYEASLRDEHTSPARRLVIEGFFREGADDRSVSFGTLRDPGGLRVQLREHGVFSPSDAEAVIVMTKPDGDRSGNHIGSVSVLEDTHHFTSIDRAIRCLEAVRAGLVEAGHSDE